MELLQTFGIDWVMLVSQIVNFLIVFYLLKRFLYKPILSTLKDREQTIKEGAKNAEEQRALLEKTKEEEKKIIREAQVTANKLIAKATLEAQNIIKETEEKAKVRAQNLVQMAKEQIVRETKEAELKLAGNISKIAIQFLEKALSELVTKRSQEEILEKAIKQIKGRIN